jgi:hypothetical protein
LTAKFAKTPAKFAKKINPRVLVETPAPPALCEERIGQGSACRDFSACVSFSNQLLAVSF